MIASALRYAVFATALLGGCASSHTHVLAFSPDGKLLADGADDGALTVRETGRGSVVRRVFAGKEGVASVAFSPDGKLLATGGWDEMVRVWDVQTGRLVRALRGHVDGVDAIAFTHDGRSLVSGGYDHDKTVRVWSELSDRQPRVLGPYRARVESIAVSPTGSLLAVSSYDASITLWRTTDWSEQTRIDGHSDGVISVAFSADGSRLASASWDATTRLWSVTDGMELRKIVAFAPMNKVLRVAFSPDGKLFAAGREFGEIDFFNTSNWAEARTVDGGSMGICSLVFSPDATKLASSSYDGSVILWRVADGARLYALGG